MVLYKKGLLSSGFLKVTFPISVKVSIFFLESMGHECSAKQEIVPLLY